MKPKIAVIGACHVTGIARTLRALVPDAVVNAWHVGASATPDAVAAALPSHDIIVTQILDLWGYEELGITRLRQLYGTTKKIVFVPTMIFWGLQPDAIYLHPGGKPLDSPTGAMHSAIVTAAFAASIPMEQVPTLFHDVNLFERVGYFDEYARAKERLLEQADFYGFDIRPHFARWEETGVFMHMPMHPRIDVLSSLATMAAIEAGMVVSDTMPPADIPDDLGWSERWPLYPILGDRLGVREGSFTWTRALPLHADGTPSERSLDEIVEAEYVIFASNPGLNLLAPQVRRIRDAILELMPTH